MSVKYSAVGYNADQSQRAELLNGQPWSFINLLPIDINVYVYTPTKTDLIGAIPAHGRITTGTSSSGLALESGYEIHVLYQPTKTIGPQYEFMRPVFLFDDSRTVRIGDVMHEARTNTWTQRAHTDIVGIRVHNHLAMPLDIYYQGQKIGYVGGDDGTDAPMSGSPGSVYLTNDNNGIRIGDEIDIALHFTPKGDVSRSHTPYCTIKIHDNYMSDLYVGVINQHYVPTMADTFSYRVDTPTVTGLVYFDQITGYQSKPTSRV